jgi:hypothetical protein
MARQISVIYLVSLSSLLRAADGYDMACDGHDDGTGIKYFDVRVSVLVDGIIANLHICVHHGGVHFQDARLSHVGAGPQPAHECRWDQHGWRL